MRRLCLVLALLPLACHRSLEVSEFEGAYPKSAHATGSIREFAIDAAPTELPLLDGRKLAVWAYNGRIPGPILRVRLGDTVRATLTNHLPQSTTIHWHGVRLPNAMDGVPGITQPPVETGQSFVYEFTPKDAGTFWFHPHLSASEQVERGLFGVLIVDDAEPPPYTQDVVWVLDDWRLDDATGQIDPAFNTRHDLMHDGRWGRVTTVNGSTTEALHVKPGERIRLRLVDVANGRVFLPDLAELDAKIIAVDGMYASRPLPPAGFEIAPGNRVDLDVTFPPSSRGRRFAIVDRMYNQSNHLAEIVVDDVAPVVTPLFPSPAHAKIPAWERAPSLPVRAEYRLNARQGGDYGIQWTINDQAFDHAAHMQHHAPHDAQRLPEGQWSKLRFVNDSYRIHPMHLHGQFFKLLSRNGKPVDEGHWRDTVLVHAKETVEVGLVPLDRGEWMMHCHILEHAESGMMTTVTVN